MSVKQGLVDEEIAVDRVEEEEMVDELEKEVEDCQDDDTSCD